MNVSAVELGRERTAGSLIALMAEQARRTPDHVAAICGSARLTYRQLHERANQLAHRLIGLGVGPDDIVAVALQPSLELVTTLLAVLKAGAAYLPLDLDLPPERWSFLLADARPRVLVGHEELTLPVAYEPNVLVDREWRRFASQPNHDPNRPDAATQLAYLMYTSGSTGTPKGVMVENRGVYNLLLWMRDQFGLTSSDHYLLKTPYYWDVSVPEVFAPLITGASIVIVEPCMQRDAAYVARAIEEHAVTTVSFVPSVLGHFLDERRHGTAANLKRVLVAGEALSPEIRDRFFAKYDAELHNIYGPTEGTVYATHWACRRGDASRTVPIGRPIRGTTAYVVDDAGRIAPVGARGELYLGGAGIARGYWRRPELTAEKFVPDRFGGEPSARLFRTGDIASLRADGELEFFGRKDDQVKIRGNRIELGEIESTLMTHESVKEAAAAVAEGLTSIVAYVVSRDGKTDAAELRAFAERKLPSFMVPSTIHFLDALPRTANGKLDRRSLAAPRPAPATAHSAATASAFERELLAVWQELLNKPVGLDDDFFASGGDSLSAVDLCATIEQRFGCSVRASLLIRAPTVRQFAAALKGDLLSSSDCLVPLRAEGTGTPIFLVHGRGGALLLYRSLVENLPTDWPIYGLQRVALKAEAHRPVGIEDLAAYYVEAIRRIQPVGPYYVGGGSFGGNVAFEVARILEVAGERIGLVMLFDAGLGLAALPGRSRLARRLTINLKKVQFHARALRALDARGRRAYLSARLDGVTARVSGAMWRLRVRHHEKKGTVPTELRDRDAEQMVAIHAYVPPSKLKGPVVLYRADEQAELWAVGNDPAFGWREYAPNIDIVHVPAAAHAEIIQVPHVHGIAADLKRRLSE